MEARQRRLRPPPRYLRAAWPSAVTSYVVVFAAGAERACFPHRWPSERRATGYRGHDTTNPRRVFISGQKRAVFGTIKRELRRRSAIEAVIGHLKNDGHLGRCFLKGRHGDAANIVLSAVGYNLRLILAWLRALLSLVLLAFRFACCPSPTAAKAC